MYMQARGPHPKNWCCQGLLIMLALTKKLYPPRRCAQQVGVGQCIFQDSLHRTHSTSLRATIASQSSSACCDVLALRNSRQTRHAVTRKLAIDRTFCASIAPRFGPICARLGIHLFRISLPISRSLLHRLGHDFVERETRQCFTFFFRRRPCNMHGRGAPWRQQIS